MRSSQKMLKILPNSAPESSPHNGILLPPLNSEQWEGNYANPIRKQLPEDDFQKVRKEY